MTLRLNQLFLGASEVGEELGILDVDRAVKMSGSMFAMYRGAGAYLLSALINYGLDRNRDAFEQVRPPTVVKTDTMIGTGHLPKFEDDAYHLPRPPISGLIMTAS